VTRSDGTATSTRSSTTIPLATRLSSPCGAPRTGSDTEAYPPRGRRHARFRRPRPVIAHTDANSNPAITTSTVYTQLTRTVTTGSLPPTSYVTDAMGRLWKVTDALGQETQYQFDSADRITRVQQFAGPLGSAISQTRTCATTPWAG